jgi:hypothetical protein
MSGIRDQFTDRPVVRIYTHDRIRGFLNWLQEWFVNSARDHCSTKCLLVEDKGKTQLNQADVLIFHAPTHKGVTNKVLNGKYLKVFISMEQPKYAKYLSDHKYLEKNFDLISTYVLRNKYPNTNVPNMPITYYPLNILTPQAVLAPPVPFNMKTGYDTGVHVAVFASNCKAAGATSRTQFISQLMKLIPIHSYGKCLNNREEPSFPSDPKWPQIAQRRARKVKTLSKYKFYMAFENFQVQDYVSEKVFESLFAGAVPIYKGTRDIWRFLPSNDSYIDANNMTPTELAALIRKLATDEGEYNKYLEYKKRPLSEEFLQITSMSYTHPNVLCRLCEYGLEHKKKKKNALVTEN